jgi:heme-degrading monooxygenase HmoA
VLTSGSESIRSSEIVISVVTAHLKNPHLHEVVDEAIEVLRGEAEEMPGFITGHVLVSTDAKKLAIVTKWRDSHTWSKSRYDERVGKMLEDCLSSSVVLDLELYCEKAYFVGLEAGAGD